MAIHAACVKVEAELAAGRADSALLGILSPAVNDALHHLAQLNAGKSAATSAAEPDPRALRAAAVELDELLAAREFISERSIAKLQDNLNAAQRPLFDKLRQHIDDFRYADARSVLQRILDDA